MINIDLTTKNTVYNTLGPQAQWIQHRFGRRDYPDVELELDNVLSVLCSTDCPINFISVYGDPSCYTHILDVLRNIDIGRCVFNSYLNFKNDQLINLLNEKHAYVVVPLFGIGDLNNKLLLGSEWDTVVENLNNLSCNVCIEWFEYHFNQHQTEQVRKLNNKSNITVNVQSGICTHYLNFSPIVDEYGNWLYDAYLPNSKWQSLQKTVNGYNSLIQYIKPKIGKNILAKPLVYDPKINYVYDTTISICATGHVFPSYSLSSIFSNALCTDWTLSFSNVTEKDKVTVNEDLKYICSAIKQIQNYLKKDITLEKKDFDEILTDLADSNV